MVLGIFRFTIYKRNFTKPLNIAGFQLSPDMISIILFAIGFALILLFVVNEVQPEFYKGRDSQPKIYGG
jgi:hypothetical protein